MVKGRFSVVKGSVVRHFRQDIWSKDLISLRGWRRRAYTASRMLYMVVTGFLGGLTRFSTFSAETVAFIEEGRVMMALSYSGVSLLGSLGLTVLGLLTAHALR